MRWRPPRRRRCAGTGRPLHPIQIQPLSEFTPTEHGEGNGDGEISNGDTCSGLAIETVNNVEDSIGGAIHHRISPELAAQKKRKDTEMAGCKRSATRVTTANINVRA